MPRPLAFSALLAGSMRASPPFHLTLGGGGRGCQCASQWRRPQQAVDSTFLRWTWWVNSFWDTDDPSPLSSFGADPGPRWGPPSPAWAPTMECSDHHGHSRQPGGRGGRPMERGAVRDIPRSDRYPKGVLPTGSTGVRPTQGCCGRAAPWQLQLRGPQGVSELGRAPGQDDISGSSSGATVAWGVTLAGLPFSAGKGWGVMAAGPTFS